MKNNTLYLKPYFIISTVISLILIVIFSFLIFNQELYITHFVSYLILALPAVISGVICYIGNKTKTKHPKLTKFFVHTLNILIIIVQSFMSFLAFIIILIFIDDLEYTNIKDYQKALKKYPQEMIEHYPQKIPSEAQNINFVYEPGGFLGDSSFYLQFDINEEYIKKEEEKYKNKGEEYIIKKDNKKPNWEFDYNLHRSISALREVNNRFYETIKDYEIGYKVKILDSSGCISGFATRKNNIIYLIYCD